MNSTAFTARDAAAEIITLINARPASPRQEEIEAIIAKVSASPPLDPESGARRQALQTAIANMESVLAETDEPPAIDDADRPLTAVTEELWSRPARTIADLQNYALLARHWFTASPTDDHGRGTPWAHPSDVDDHGERAMAELIHAVLGFEGGGSMAPAATYDREAMARWDRAVRAYVDRCDDTLDDATGSQLIEELCVSTRDVWAQPVRCWADVILLAAVTVHWNAAHNVGDPPYPDDRIAEGCEHQMDEFAVAKLVRAVLDLAGLRFDRDGRLLSPPA